MRTRTTLLSILTLILVTVIPAHSPMTTTAQDSTTIPTRIGPVAAFTYFACVPCAVPGDMVFFNANNSASPYGTINLYTWNFGDNTSIQNTTSPQINHGYFSNSAKWIVTLTVTDNNKRTDTISQLVIFFVEPSFTIHPTRPRIGEPVTFNATDSYSYGNYTIKDYLWTLGDGTNATGAITKHTYLAPGLYRVTITLQTPNGNPETSKTVRVSRTIFQGTFDNVNVNITGTVNLDTTTNTLTVALDLTTTDTTAGTILYTKFFNFTVTYADTNPPRFILVIPANGDSIATSCTVNTTTGETICALSRNPDLANQGIVNIVNLATLAMRYGTTPTSLNWSRAADLNNDGAVNILDLAIAGSDFGARTFQ